MGNADLKEAGVTMNRDSKTVETVRGPVQLADLGPTLMHEHIFILDPEAYLNFGHAWGVTYWNEEKHVATAAEKLRAVHEAGIATLVDATAIGLGRDIRRLQRLNTHVDINIIVATGIFACMEMPQFFRYRDVDALTEFFVRELRNGIDNTGVKAAFLKCAVDEYGLIGDVPKLLSAVAAASLETGAPIMVHTNAEAQTGRLALDYLVREGVAPTRVVVAHMGDSDDLDYLRAVADRGATLGYDRFGGEHRISDRKRLATLVALIEQGYADRVHVSHDAATFLDFVIGDQQWSDLLTDYMHIPTAILPALLEAGVTQAQIEQIMVENPRRFFNRDGVTPDYPTTDAATMVRPEGE